MTVSIVIVNYKTPDLLSDCVRSISSSNIQNKYEVVVVDNGSGEESVEVINQLSDKGLIDKMVFNKKNLGFSTANNIGIKISKSKYKLLLNSDTIVHNDAVDKLIYFADNNPSVGVIGSRLLNKDGSIQASCFNFPTIKAAIEQYWIGSGSPLDKFAPDGTEPTKVDSVVGASFLISPKALKKVGLLDERYFMFFEDIDYCRRTWQTGLEVYYLPESKVTHLHGQSGKKIASDPEQWRRLIPSSKLYHGIFKHYLFNIILWSGQKLRK